MRVCILISAICILTVPTANAEGLPTEEFLIDTSGTHTESQPAVAFDGENFLVVWKDSRNADTPDIYGTRVTPTGTVLDPTGIAISTAAYWQYEPAVAFDGENFLVVWAYGPGGPICGARVTPAGAVLDSTGFQISGSGHISNVHPTLAFDGTNFLVAWEMASLYYEAIGGARVTPDGAVLEGFTVVAAWDGPSALAFDGENYLVTWSNGDICGTRVTPAGVVLDSAWFAISSADGRQVCPAIAFDRMNYLVVWQDDRSGSYDIRGARVTPVGVVLDTASIAIATAENEQTVPGVSFDGTNFLVVWQDGRYPPDSGDLYGARVRPDGTVFDGDLVVTQEGTQSSPALARGPGSQLFLVYQGWTGAVGNNIYDTDRIWGMMDPIPAIAEVTNPKVRMTNSGVTIVRGVLMIGDRGWETGNRAELLDISGRKAADLHPGANDVRHLSPGVYFVCTKGKRDQGIEGSSVRKVVVTR